MRLKAVLADLAHTYSVHDRSLTVPLGIGYVKAYAKHALGDAIDISLFKSPDRFLKAVHDERPDIVGFANYGWNENLNRAIGRHVRKIVPNALIVAGGPNIDPAAARRVSFLQKHEYLDFLIIDGGEEAFIELAQWQAAGGRDRSALPCNIVWLDHEGLHETPERPLKKIIEHLPSPYLAGYLDEFLAAGMVPLFETNRGCPFQCTFCAWGSASKDLVRRIDLDQSLAEIAYVGERSNASNWIVCDANFGILPRDIELAKAIRAVHDAHGTPKKCHTWLAKNVTERNLVIGGILGDMVEPVMAVQSMDDEVLANIKRDNISLETYAKYQQKFKRIGSRTYSDVIVPLPSESLKSHLAGLRTLADLGVDIIQNHNMRLLAGAETNSQVTRERFEFRTQHRLMHGDAGEYKAPDGEAIRAFEHEESLRSTATMSEADLFWLRKLHFLVDFCWNIEVYRPLLSLAHLYGTNPIDILISLVASDELTELFADFDARSRDEWFADASAIEEYFAVPENWARLLNREFEKLNIQFSIIGLLDHKAAFDRAMMRVLKSEANIPPDILAETAKLTFALFPPMDSAPSAESITIPDNLAELNSATIGRFALADTRVEIQLHERGPRINLRSAISSAHGATLSKILNTQGLSLRDLRLSVSDNFRFDGAFRREAAPVV